MCDELFEKLRTETPPNKNFWKGGIGSSAAACAAIPSRVVDTVEQSSDYNENINQSRRRDSLPEGTKLENTELLNKSRSLSPTRSPDISTTAHQQGKQLKVLIARTNLQTFSAKHVEIKETTAEKRKRYVSSGKKLQSPKKPSSPVVKTPTKAQKKLFSPDLLQRAEQLAKYKLKKFVIRVQRVNLRGKMKQLLKQNKQTTRKAKSHLNVSAPPKLLTSNDETNRPIRKRKLSLTDSQVATVKADKKRHSTDAAVQKKKQKLDSRVQIKLTPLRPRNKLKEASKKKQTIKSANNSNTYRSTPIKAVKYTKLQLIHMHGKRTFNSYVRIERCHHPLMVTFESNARARREKIKKNKLKNLSVSFNEQVEVIGDSDIDSECLTPDDEDSHSRTAINKNDKLLAPVIPMPKSLKKIDTNGKIIDDFDIDPNIFVGPENVCENNSGTSTNSCHKKKDKILFSPLKTDEGARKEEFKRANECAPPLGLRGGLSAADDDEDEDAEYIVPINLPERRPSYTNTSNAVDVCTNNKEDEINVSDCAQQNITNDADTDMPAAVKNAAVNEERKTENDISSDMSYASAENNESVAVEEVAAKSSINDNDEDEIVTLAPKNIAGHLIEGRASIHSNGESEDMETVIGNKENTKEKELDEDILDTSEVDKLSAKLFDADNSVLSPWRNSSA